MQFFVAERYTGKGSNFNLTINSVMCLQPSPTTFSEVFQNMFDYIDRIFSMIRPRKLLYMAIGMFANVQV